MKNDFTIKGIEFHIGGYTPRKNEFEKGLKYQLYVNDRPTGYKFCTKHECKEYAEKNYWCWY